MRTKGFKILKVLAFVLLVLTLSLGQTSAAWADSSSAKTICEENGGTWYESSILQAPSGHVRARPAAIPFDPDNTGTCYYSDDSGFAEDVCGAGYSLTLFYLNGEVDDGACTYTGGAGSPYVTGECGDVQEGASSEPVTLVPCAGTGGYATFDPGSCFTACSVTRYLPRAAEDSLPDDAIATLYVKVRGEEGAPSLDDYTACFGNPDGQSLTLFRFVSGAWQALVTSSADPICASASGDGAFYIGPAN